VRALAEKVSRFYRRRPMLAWGGVPVNLNDRRGAVSGEAGLRAVARGSAVGTRHAVGPGVTAPPSWTSTTVGVLVGSLMSVSLRSIHGDRPTVGAGGGGGVRCMTDVCCPMTYIPVSGLAVDQAHRLHRNARGGTER
jgi:hypothetical protein